MCLLAASLIAGMHVGRPLWPSILALGAGIILGFFLAQTVIPIIGVLWMLPLGAAILSGLLVVAAPGFSAPVWLGIIFALGFSVGLETDPEGVFLIDSVRTISGLVTAAIIVLVVTGFPLSRTGLEWVRVLVRIIGSWITAIAIMVLALNFQ